MSSPLNPLPPQEPQLPAQITPAHQEPIAANASGEDPPWTGWDVLLLVVVFFLIVNILGAAALVFVGALHLFGYSLSQLLHNHSELDRLSHDLRVLLPVQLVSYALLLMLMFWVVRMRGQQGFLESVRWRWPHGRWPGYLIAGAILAVAVQLLSSLLPIPHSLPIDRFFQNATQAYLMAILGILVAPFIEELFFRGFLYPVLARRWGVAVGVVVTALAFALVHGSQLGYSWAALLMLLLVGLALTIVRERTKSVAPGVLLHMGYNLALFVFFFIATDGFRHLTTVLSSRFSVLGCHH